jgi:hypothetical protein
MSQSARRARRRTKSARSLWRKLRLPVLLAFFCLAVLVVVFALLEGAHLPLAKSAAGTTSCAATLVTTAGQSAKWYSIASGSAADVVKAAQCTAMYQNAAQGDDPIAYAMQNGKLANPVLVKPYRSNVGLAQYWVIPVVDASAHPLAFLTFLYDPQSKLLHEGEFDAVTGNMFYVNHVFPAVTANAAVAAVSLQDHVTMIQGQTPDLIYFPGDLVKAETAQHPWQAGGTSVIDPIWRVPGADGTWRYVDHDGHAHLSTDLPVDPNYQSVPSATVDQ